MAIGDELDKLLADNRLLKEDWDNIVKVLDVDLPAELHQMEQCNCETL
jgi:hypothetical protein